MSSARACRRTRRAFDVVQGLVVDGALGVLSDGLEDILHGDVAPLVASGQDRSSVEEDGRHIESEHRHHHARQRFVAARDSDERVVAVSAHGELDRIGDEVAAD